MLIVVVNTQQKFYNIVVNDRYVYIITQQKAEDLLKADLIIHENNVSKLVKIPLNQNQFDALVSFEYNIGYGNFASSTLLKDLNAKNYIKAAGQFERWVYGGGKKLKGLENRRKAEKELFISSL